MSFCFATCERDRALQFIKQMFPSRSHAVTDTGVISEVLDLVDADKIRVLDPSYHSGGIIQAKASDAEWDEAQSVLRKMVAEIMSISPKKEQS